MTEERMQQIEAAIAEAEALGEKWTNASIRARVPGGSSAAFKQYMKARRVQQAGGVAVAEAPEDEEDEEDEPAEDTPERPAAAPSAAALTAEYHRLDGEYKAYYTTLEELRATGVWDEHVSNRERFLEKTLVKNLREQERVLAAIPQAKIREGVYAAQLQHDAELAEAARLAEAALQAVAAVAHAFEDLSEVFSTQVDRWFAFRDARGHQAFDVADGPTYALQLFQQFFGGDPRARDAFQLLTSTSPTIGQLRQALANCPRLQPFSPRAIAQYLEQQTEGASNGHS